MDDFVVEFEDGVDLFWDFDGVKVGVYVGDLVDVVVGELLYVLLFLGGWGGFEVFGLGGEVIIYVGELVDEGDEVGIGGVGV